MAKAVRLTPDGLLFCVFGGYIFYGHPSTGVFTCARCVHSLNSSALAQPSVVFCQMCTHRLSFDNSKSVHKSQCIIVKLRSLVWETLKLGSLRSWLSTKSFNLVHVSRIWQSYTSINVCTPIQSVSVHITNILFCGNISLISPTSNRCLKHTTSR